MGLAASSSQGRLAQSLALAQARSEVRSVPRCGDEMFLASFGVIVLACMIWVVLDVEHFSAWSPLFHRARF